jgi:DnaK suppressor protein
VQQADRPDFVPLIGTRAGVGSSFGRNLLHRNRGRRFSDIVCHESPLYKRRAQGTFALPDGLMPSMPTTTEKQKPYRPSEKEPFMNERQREYFRAKLLTWKEDILREAKATLVQLQDENVNHPDLADRASSETDRAIELRARDRQRKLIAKIDAAIGRIEDGTYGYCEETGEPIALKRLEARPIATLSVEAQERHEKREKVYRDE